jgi:hypothetical protein
MTKYSSQDQRRVVVVVAIIGFFLATLFISSTSVWAQPGFSNAIISAGGAGGVVVGSQIDVNVYLYEDSALQESFGNLNLLITYDPVALTFIGLTQGALLDSCGWESFQYQEGPLLPDRNAIRIAAVADLDNGSHHPNSYLAGREGPLAKMTFLVSGDSAYLWDSGTQLKFYWNDCQDNTLSSVANDSVFYSIEICDPICYPSSPPTLGTYLGAPESCLIAEDGRTHVRQISFAHGGIYIWPPDTIDTRGDLNLNGITNELADIVIYTNYFMLGLDAFPASGREAVIAASDINADGIVLTYRDLVYLWRINIGDAQPIGKQPAVANVDAYFHQDSTNHSVAVTCELPLAGAFMLIRGNVTPTFLIPGGWSEQAFYDGTYTRILILGEPSQPYNDGVWFTYQGTGKLEYVETTDWHDVLITSHITNVATDCGNFNGSGGIDISDVVYVIRYIFSGGVAPIDIHGGDVNCDGTCDISDIVYILAYIFSGGSAPCANCK